MRPPLLHVARYLSKRGAELPPSESIIVNLDHVECMTPTKDGTTRLHFSPRQSPSMQWHEALPTVIEITMPFDQMVATLKRMIDDPR